MSDQKTSLQATADEATAASMSLISPAQKQQQECLDLLQHEMEASDSFLINDDDDDGEDDNGIVGDDDNDNNTDEDVLNRSGSADAVLSNADAPGERNENKRNSNIEDSSKIIGTPSSSDHGFHVQEEQEDTLIATESSSRETGRSTGDGDEDRDEGRSNNKELLGHRMLHGFNLFLSKFHYLVLLIIIIGLWPAGFIAMKELTSNTDSTFRHGIPGSPSAIAENIFDQKYYLDNSWNKAWDHHPSILVVLSIIKDGNHNNSSKSSLIHNEYARNTSLSLQPYLENIFIVDENSGNSTNPNTTSSSNVHIDVTSYYSYQHQNVTLLGIPYMSQDQQMTILQIDYTTSQDVKRAVVLAQIAAGLEEFYTNATCNDIDVGFTGLDYFSHDLREATQKDLKRMDVLVLPLSLLLLGYTINPQRLWIIWIIPLIAIISSVATWSLITYHIIMKHYQIQITQFTPSIMMSLSLGMGMDYTLFLLSRYYESYNTRIKTATITERRRTNRHRYDDEEEEDAEAARQCDTSVIDGINRSRITAGSYSKDGIKSQSIFEMLRHTGKVILVSGITLMCTFLGLIALPLSMLQSVGWGAAVTIASSIVMNLVVVPALLHTRLGDLIFVDNNEIITPRGESEDDLDQEEEERGPIQPELPPEAPVLLVEPTETTRSRHNGDGNGRGLNHLRQPLLENGDFSEISNHPESDVIVLPVNRPSFWIRLSKNYLLHPYKSIILMLLLFQFLFWPLGKNAIRLKSTSIAFESLLPSQSRSMKTYQRLMKRMGKGPGKMTPFRVLIDFTKSSSVLDSPYGFDILHRLAHEMLRPPSSSEPTASAASPPYALSTKPMATLSTDLAMESLYSVSETTLKLLMTHDSLPTEPDPATDHHRSYRDSYAKLIPKAAFTGISVLDNLQIPYTIYRASKMCGEGDNGASWCSIEAVRALNVLDSIVTSSDRNATYLTVELPVSPFSDKGIYWLTEMRKRISDFMQNHTVGSTVGDGIEIYIDGSAAIAHDAVEAVYRAFPWVIGITLGIVFCLLGLYFDGSIVPPLRSVVSISCTLAVAFGAVVLFYQDSMAHARTLMATVPELCWLVPVMGFSIIVGLALDYDVFLVSRIYEFRSIEEYQHQSSIVAGLHATGGIITAAGVIMATAFGSLLWSASPALNQWAFLVTAAVLLDTFVIRTTVVPILMGWTGSYSWYPKQFEKSGVPSKRLEGFDEDNVEPIGRGSHALSRYHREEQGRLSILERAGDP